MERIWVGMRVREIFHSTTLHNYKWRIRRWFVQRPAWQYMRIEGEEEARTTTKATLLYGSLLSACRGGGGGGMSRDLRVPGADVGRR